VSQPGPHRLSEGSSAQVRVVLTGRTQIFFDCDSFRDYFFRITRSRHFDNTECELTTSMIASAIQID
jgi:hypothetical protein